MANVSCAVTAGSSPRVRGKLRYRHYPLLVARIIPAHAGQTCCRRRPSRSRPDHPRACGANNFEESKPLPAIGSSPRMRGKPRSSTRRSPTPRIIPAHAGQTSDYFSSEIISSDHPRACGANLIVFGVVHTHLGSSPRMRGKPHCFRCRPYSPRIIPAHAGQTRQTLHIECGLEDHPRACGANSRSKNLNPRRLGSSPRMRGKRRPWV